MAQSLISQDPSNITLHKPVLSLGSVREDMARRVFSSNPVPREQSDIEIEDDVSNTRGSFSKGRSVFVIAILTGIIFASSMSTGFLTVGLPRIAKDLRLQNHLLLWYVLTFSPILVL